MEKKEIMICLHGFGEKKTRELDLIQQQLSDEIEIIMPDLFDSEDPEDNDAVLWANRGFLLVEDYVMQGYAVTLLGFSMGGVIAAYCASKLAVNKCILLSPAFDLINIRNVNNIIVTLAKNGVPDEMKNFNALPSTFLHTLFDVVVLYRDYIKQLNTPTLMIHGMLDCIVSYKSSRVAFNHIPCDKKQLFLLERGHHVLSEDPAVKFEVIELIRLFLHNKIVNGSN